MSKPRCTFVAFVSIAATSITIAPAQEPAESLGSRLPPNVRALLIQEMNAILEASHTILDALVRGQHDIVAEQASLIRDSFIMQQRMTPADRMALRAAAPQSFIQKDEIFTPFRNASRRPPCGAIMRRNEKYSPRCWTRARPVMPSTPAIDSPACRVVLA